MKYKSKCNSYRILWFILCVLHSNGLIAQSSFSLLDTLRGSISAERAWWDVLRYDLTFTPDYNNKTISGFNSITYRVVEKQHTLSMQIDLKEPLQIDSVIQQGRKLKFEHLGSVWYVSVPGAEKAKVQKLQIYYHGKVHEAKNPPWDGGFTFTQDSLGRPWMTVTCQGKAGASIWYPCKDHQSDEPDHGASLTMIVPDTLVAIANGRLQFLKKDTNGTAVYSWGVVNPISNYCIIPYIGKYVNFKETYPGEKGLLDLNYWVLDYNVQKAKAFMPDQVHKMFKSFEYWFGPYPFYEDGYQLIETSNTGMEHQSAVSYGNHYAFGYRGRSHSIWGMKFDFIIIHESAHEWFGNNITTKDLADMWVHEGFANYSETLFTESVFGIAAANEYNLDSRKGIKNDIPIIPQYHINAQGSGDMYPKGGNLLHSIRQGIGNDHRFRKMLRGINKAFYHQTVTSRQIESYISSKLKYNLSAVFDQYLRTTQIPVFEFYLNKTRTKLFYRYTQCVKGFNLPITMKNQAASIQIIPGEDWKSILINPNLINLFTKDHIETLYYVKAMLASKNRYGSME